MVLSVIKIYVKPYVIRIPCGGRVEPIELNAIELRIAGGLLEYERGGIQSLLSGQRLGTVLFQELFEVLTLDLDGPAQLHARDLPAAEAPVDPTLAHTQLLAKLRYREQIQALPLLRTLLSLPTDGLFEF
jgi:hypothetical protein